MDYGNARSGILFIKYKCSDDEIEKDSLFPPHSWKATEYDIMVNELRTVKLSAHNIHFSTVWDKEPKKPTFKKGTDKVEKDARNEVYQHLLDKNQEKYGELISNKTLIVLCGQLMVNYHYGKGEYSTPWGIQLPFQENGIPVFAMPEWKQGFSTIGEIRLSLERIREFIDKEELL